MNGTNGNGGQGASTALVTRQPEPRATASGGGGDLALIPRSVDELARLAKVFATSGLFKDTRQAEQCAVKMLAGMELGLAPMASMRSLHVFQGQVTLSAPLLASIIKRAKPRYNFKIRKHDATICEIEFFEDGESSGVSSFTIEEAKKAGLASKDVWQNYPKNMLFSRALSNGAKWYCAELFNGPIYTPDEFGASVDAQGTVIDVTPAPASSTSESTPFGTGVRAKVIVPDGYVAPEVAEAAAEEGSEASEAEKVDYSPIGEIVEGTGELLETEEERAEIARKEEAARAVEVERIKKQIKRLNIKADATKRLFMVDSEGPIW